MASTEASEASPDVPEEDPTAAAPAPPEQSPLIRAGDSARLACIRCVHPEAPARDRQFEYYLASAERVSDVIRIARDRYPDDDSRVVHVLQEGRRLDLRGVLLGH